MKIDGYAVELINILKKEVQSFNTINELLTLEEKSLIGFDTKSLTGILERQEDVFSSIACLEKSRLEILDKISDASGVTVDDLTITRLSEIIDGDLQKKLVDTGHVLERVYEDIKKKKMSNNMLINQGILLIESDILIILKALGKKDAVSSGYSAKAENKTVTGSVLIDGRM